MVAAQFSRSQLGMASDIKALVGAATPLLSSPPAHAAKGLGRDNLLAIRPILINPYYHG